MDKKTTQEQIEKLRKGIASPVVDESLKAGMRKKLADLEAKLSQLEEEAAAKQDDAKPEKQEKPEKPAKQKVTPENKKQVVEKCTGLINDLKKVLHQYDATVAAPRRASRAAHKAKKRRASEIVSSGIAGTVTRVVKMELSRDKVAKIKVDRLRDARDKFADGLKALRGALGGISSDNEGFIEDFEKSFNALIKTVEEKQKDIKGAA